MLIKVVISRDRHNARVYFSTHCVDFSSDKDVVILLHQVLFEPITRHKNLINDQHEMWLRSLDKTADVIPNKGVA